MAMKLTVQPILTLLGLYTPIVKIFRFLMTKMGEKHSNFGSS